MAAGREEAAMAGVVKEVAAGILVLGVKEVGMVVLVAPTESERCCYKLPIRTTPSARRPVLRHSRGQRCMMLICSQRQWGCLCMRWFGSVENIGTTPLADTTRRRGSWSCTMRQLPHVLAPARIPGARQGTNEPSR